LALFKRGRTTVTGSSECDEGNLIMFWKPKADAEKGHCKMYSGITAREWLVGRFR